MQHHANFFFDTVSQAQFYPEFVGIALPQRVRKLINLSTIAVEEKHFVDEELKAHQSDILFSVQRKNGRECNLYLLFEHKSHPDSNILLQLLRYMWRIYESQKTLSPVLPIVFHHGPEKWDLARSFQDLLDLDDEEQKAIREFILNFRYILVDAKDMDIGALQASPPMETFLTVLRFVWDFDSEAVLRRFLADHREIFFDTNQRSFLEKVLAYIYRVQNIEPQRLGKLIAETVSEEGADVALTAVAKLEAKARQEGRQEGERIGEERGEKRGEQRGEYRGKLQTAQRMQDRGYPIADILAVTGLRRKDLKKAGLLE